MNDDIDLSSIQIPWPQKGDCIVSAHGDPRFHAAISETRDLIHYIDGFKRAADALWRLIEAEPKAAGVGALVCPMIFLYRHYVELSLKDVIHLAGHLSESRVEVPWGHGLKKLWQQARPLLSAIEPSPSDEDLDVVSDLIDQLDGIDPESVAFRYPTATDRKTKVVRSNLAGGLKLNLKVFCAGVEKLASFLEACRGMLTDYAGEHDQ